MVEFKKDARQSKNVEDRRYWEVPTVELTDEFRRLRAEAPEWYEMKIAQARFADDESLRVGMEKVRSGEVSVESILSDAKEWSDLIRGTTGEKRKATFPGWSAHIDSLGEEYTNNAAFMERLRLMKASSRQSSDPKSSFQKSVQQLLRLYGHSVATSADLSTDIAARWKVE